MTTSIETSNPYVKSDTQDGVATVEFFHPEHNSLPGSILAQLATAITEAGEDEQVKVVILKSGGSRTFCAGASFQELINIDNPERGKTFFMGFANVINAMRKCPKFIIGRVQGKAVGGGVGIASASDYCMATQFAAIKLSELNLGIGPFVVGPAIQRKLGLSAMSQIGIDANSFYDAEWARQKGLYTHTYDSTEALDEAVHAFAKHLATYNIIAMRDMKKSFWEGTEHWDALLEERAQTSGKLVLGDFTKQCLAKYK